VIRYLNLPAIPVDIMSRLNRDFGQYKTKANPLNKFYVWSDDFNEEVNRWCQQNICDTMYWGFQIMTGDQPMHKDNVTLTKLIYLINTGGDNVYTRFYDDDKNLTHSYKIECNRWHLLKADSYHSVDGVESGQTRFSLTGRIFPEA
jgi:hypothetical protein